ncbi:MAG TPA: M14 family metallopeptidase [Terriglobia bacterium]|nr:M14 family metallopeptidase [Terriglobia bacterium]
MGKVGVFLAIITLYSAQVRSQSGLSQLKTRAERTNYVETSRYDDVVAFLNTVAKASSLVHTTTFGYTFEGRPLPLAVVGRVSDATSATVRASGKLRIYIQANIHAGEVEGKESAQALVRDIAMGRYAQWLDSIVLLIAPIYNADGNERVLLTNRGPQHGPLGGMGIRANAQGLNINRDNIKLDTPEARSMVKLLNDYDPHVMIDLHTTNGSHHAYHLTWEIPNNPAAASSITKVARDEWMQEVTKVIKAKYGWDLHSYGDVSGQAPERVWTTVEDLPRYTHNYWGLRNRFGILSETYSYLTFKDRITTATRFLEEILNFAHGNAARIRKTAEDADSESLIGRRLSLRSKVKRSDQKAEVLMGDTEEEVNPYSGHVMLRRLDVRKPEQMWMETTFEPVESERVPSEYYLPAGLRSAVERLQAHGIRIERLGQPSTLQLEEFHIESNQAAAPAFEGHQERTISGKYEPVERTLPAGTYRVPMNQPLARLAFYLIEPRSNDGLLTWNVLDDALKDSTVYPILRSRR